MFSTFGKMLKDEPGAMAIEYALIAAPTPVAATAVFTTAGTKLNTIMMNTAKRLK